MRALWHLLWSEHTTPREIGFAVALGVFVGCTPAVGFHGWIALGVATLLGLNRIWAWLGSRVSNIVLLPWIAIAEVEIAHRARFGVWLHLTKEQLLAHREKLLLDWAIGCIPVGFAAALFFGFLAFGVARFRSKKKALAR